MKILINELFVYDIEEEKLGGIEIWSIFKKQVIIPIMNLSTHIGKYELEKLL
jgi:hypothetical protein